MILNNLILEVIMYLATFFNLNQNSEFTLKFSSPYLFRKYMNRVKYSNNIRLLFFIFYDY